MQQGEADHASACPPCRGASAPLQAQRTPMTAAHSLTQGLYVHTRQTCARVDLAWVCSYYVCDVCHSLHSGAHLAPGRPLRRERQSVPGQHALARVGMGIVKPRLLGQQHHAAGQIGLPPSGLAVKSTVQHTKGRKPSGISAAQVS